jgi:hypothetical protein
MKKLLVIILALGLFSAMPVLAAEHAGMDMGSHEGMKMDTAEGARECALQAESIQQKIKRLNAEIAKGSKKYSADDLKKLEKKLKEANEILDQINRN